MQKAVTKDPKRKVKYVRSDKPGKLVSAGRRNSKKKRHRNYVVISLVFAAILGLIVWLADLDWEEIINRQ
ncbi:MAG: hypothetical protein WA584_18610 [Pyrinomonadaceae bacterium]